MHSHTRISTTAQVLPICVHIRTPHLHLRTQATRAKTKYEEGTTAHVNEGTMMRVTVAACIYPMQRIKHVVYYTQANHIARTVHALRVR